MNPVAPFSCVMTKEISLLFNLCLRANPFLWYTATWGNKEAPTCSFPCGCVPLPVYV